MQKLTSIQKILKFFSLIKYNKKDYFLYFIQAFIRGAQPLIHVIFIEKIVFAITKQDIFLLEKTLYLYIFIIFSYELLWFLTRKFGWVITIPEADKNIYDMYLNKFIQMNNTEVEKIGIGKIIAILENGRFRWSESLADSIEKGMSLFILLSYVFYITFSHGIYYTIGFLSLLVLSVSILVVVNNYQFRYRRRRSEIRNNRLRLITKILMSKNEILQTDRISSEIEKIENYSKEMSQINLDMSNGRTIQNKIMSFFISISLFVFVSFFGRFVVSGDMTLSQFVGITSIFLVINSAISNFIVFYLNLTKEFIDIEKLWDFFENTSTLQGYDEGKKFKYKSGNIEIKNLTYSYYEGKNVFENFSLDIAGGKITALVGNSGSGKTTLVKLISGYIKANSGDIIIDGQKLSDISLKSYYNDIGYLTQEPSVFDGSVLENLTYAIDRKLKDGELDEVIKQANCEFIYDLQDSLETQIGEKGVRLSGGQKQRLAIAKIMLKNPKIIILDEPTSALDSFSEEQITKAMNNLFIGRTVIVIAHRLQTVRHADTIFVMEDSQVKESGTHEDLIKKGGIYAKMLELQSGF
ncbi:ABC transporter ATP-binding protein/permease [Candidatus Gracilibacteria bacterium]|nr:ABC transporter ATP-binding protein/permease [Candidatus Gracilibacteria bacterium]